MRSACGPGALRVAPGYTAAPGSRRATSVRRVAAAPHPAERAALDALLQRVAEAHRPPVLTSQRVTDVAARHLAAVLEQVLDQRQLAIEPELVLVGVTRRRAGEGGVGAHWSPRSVCRGRSARSRSRSKRGAFSVPRPSPRPSV